MRQVQDKNESQLHYLLVYRIDSTRRQRSLTACSGKATLSGVTHVVLTSWLHCGWYIRVRLSLNRAPCNAAERKHITRPEAFYRPVYV
jgi:hypothetical protein